MHTPNQNSSTIPTPVVSSSTNFTMPPSVDTINTEMRRNSSPELKFVDFKVPLYGAGGGVSIFQIGPDASENTASKFYGFDYSGGMGVAGRDHVRPVLKISQFCTLLEEDEDQNSPTQSEANTPEAEAYLLQRHIRLPIPHESLAGDGKKEKNTHKRTSSHPDLKLLPETELQMNVPLSKRCGSSPNLVKLLDASGPTAGFPGQQRGGLFTTYPRSRSVPPSPKVSPKLLRKNINQQIDLAFPENKPLLLSNMTGVLRKLKHQQQAMVQEEMKVSFHSEEEMRVQTAAVPQPSVAPEPSPKGPSLVGEKKSVVSSIFSWATTSKVDQSMKEMNIYAPQTL